jgi:hypothetical protein
MALTNLMARAAIAITPVQTITLSQADITGISTNNAGNWGWFFNAGGSVTVVRADGVSNSYPNWANPAPPTGGPYYIRYTAVVGTAFDNANTYNVWRNLDSGAQLYESVNSGGFANKTTLVEISTTQSTTGLVASANFSVSIEQ